MSACCFKRPFWQNIFGYRRHPWWLAGGISPSDVLAVWQPEGALSYACSKMDLSGGCFNAYEGNAPSWDAVNGWMFDRTNLEYLDTGISGDMLVQSMSMVIKYSNPDNSDWNALVALANAGQYFGIEIFKNSQIFWGCGSNQTSVVVRFALPWRFLAFTYSTMAYYDFLSVFGTPLFLPYSAPIGTDHVLIGASGGAAPFHFATVNIQAIAIYTTSLSNTQISAVYNDMFSLCV